MYVFFVEIDVAKQIEYWLSTSENDFEAARHMFALGRHYQYCCFFCHLVIEKSLKALVVKKTTRMPPYSHDLVLLADRCDLPLDKSTRLFFEEMNRFVIEARYPEEKLTAYQLATKEYTASCIEKTEQFRLRMRELVRQ